MAIAGTFAGPMFNIFMGVGLSLTLEEIKKASSGDDHHHTHIAITLGRNTDILKITFVSVLVSLFFSLFAISISDFHLRRWYGYSLIAIYLAYFSWTMVYVLADAGLINISCPKLPSWL